MSRLSDDLVRVATDAAEVIQEDPEYSRPDHDLARVMLTAVFRELAIRGYDTFVDYGKRTYVLPVDLADDIEKEART